MTKLKRPVKAIAKFFRKEGNRTRIGMRKSPRVSLYRAPKVRY